MQPSRQRWLFWFMVVDELSNRPRPRDRHPPLGGPATSVSSDRTTRKLPGGVWKIVQDPPRFLKKSFAQREKAVSSRPRHRRRKKGNHNARDTRVATDAPQRDYCRLHADHLDHRTLHPFARGFHHHVAVAPHRRHRRHPQASGFPPLLHFDQEALSAALNEHRMCYGHFQELGGPQT